MGFNLDPKTPPMERELTYLLRSVCEVGLLHPAAYAADEICKMAELDAETFAESVVAAEGLNQAYERELVRKIATKFRERFGADPISASAFIDRVRRSRESW